MRNGAVKKYGARGKGYRLRDNMVIKAMKAAHLLAAFAWGGGAFAMQALGFMGRYVPPGHGLNAENIAACAYFIDTWVVMPGLFGCILTGLFYSLGTSIGFFKFAWIGYKWLITISAAFWGLMFWGPCGNQLIEALAPYDLDWMLLFVRSFILPETVAGVLFQTGIVLSVCLISVYRPVSFRLWRMNSGKNSLRNRIRGAKVCDMEMRSPSPLDNPQVRALYDSWLGAPLGPQAQAHLHMTLRDKSARIRKLKISGLYPEKHEIS